MKRAFRNNHFLENLMYLFFVFIILFLVSYILVEKEKDIFFKRDHINNITNIEPVDKIKEVTKEIKEEKVYYYGEIINSCGPYFNGVCVNARLEPKLSGEIIYRLRDGVLLKIFGKVFSDGKNWYKVSFEDEWLRYEERVPKYVYISSDYISEISKSGVEEISLDNLGKKISGKKILIDRSEQNLYAYNEDDTLFMKERVSTGLKETPTPRGTFYIYKKQPSRYMQGPIPGISDHYYDLPGVPWNLYFTNEGAIIHGAYWHDQFGKVWSNGCVNLPIEKAKVLYGWAELGTEVLVRD